MFLSGNEAKTLILSRVYAAGGEAVSEAELEGLYDWAWDTRVSNTMLDLILDGSVIVTNYTKEDGPTVVAKEYANVR